MEKIKKIWRKFKRKVNAYSSSIYSFLKMYLGVFIAVILIAIYLFGTYILWCKYNHLFSGLKEVITIQIQATALFIGIIAATIGLYNYWRKSGVKLVITIDSTFIDYLVTIKNLKDKEITIFNLYLYILIDKKRYMLDVLNSETNVKKDISIKAYGHKRLELHFPKAIRIEGSKIEGIFHVDEYIYLNPFVKHGKTDHPKYNNIIITELRRNKSLQYLANTSEGVYKAKTKQTLPISIKNKLTFCDRAELIADYCSYRELKMLSSTADEFIEIDPKSVSDESIDEFVRDSETTDKELKKQTLGLF